MIKTKIAAAVMAVAVLAGSTAVPAFANTDPAAEQAAYTETTETTEQEKPDPDADYDEDYGDEIDIPEDDMDDEFDE